MSRSRAWQARGDCTSCRTDPDSRRTIPFTAVTNMSDWNAAGVAVLAGQTRTAKPRLEPQPRPALLPASYAQQRLWFVERLEGGTVEYNMSQALRLRGPLDVTALERAIQTIVARHETLHTHFAEVNGEPIQVIDPAAHLSMRVEPLASG